MNYGQYTDDATAWTVRASNLDRDKKYFSYP